jgi:hypothetical protein
MGEASKRCDETGICERAHARDGGRERRVAGPTRLELATSGVTGRRSNQLNYDPALKDGPTSLAGEG